MEKMQFKWGYIFLTRRSTVREYLSAILVAAHTNQAFVDGKNAILWGYIFLTRRSLYMETKHAF